MSIGTSGAPRSRGLFVLLAACTGPFLAPPSAQDIAAKPAKSGLRDAHFTLDGHLVSGAADVQVKGEGLMVFKPASASRMVLTGTVGILPISIELISVDSVDYERVGSAKWTGSTASVKPVAGGTWATAKNLKLIGDEELPQGKAWHVRGTTNDQGFDLWVRESDGYPLKYVSDDPNASLTLVFDRFDTGQRVSAPAPADIKPEPRNATGVVGQPVQTDVRSAGVRSESPATTAQGAAYAVAWMRAAASHRLASGASPATVAVRDAAAVWLW